MEKIGVLVVALVLTAASAVAAAETKTVASVETSTVAPAEPSAGVPTQPSAGAPAEKTAATVILAHEKSSVTRPAPSAEAAETGGCCACPPEPIVTGDVYIGPANAYVFRGNKLNSPGSFVIQGGIDLTYKEFTLSYWVNMQNRNTGYRKAKITENDLILDYAVPYVLPFAQKLKFNVGTQYFALDALEDTDELYFKASLDTLLKPTLAVYWDVLEATRAGLFYTASIAHKIEIEHNLLNLNLGALVSYNQRNPSAAVDSSAVDAGLSDGRDGAYNGWHDYELTTSLDYTPTGNITISPSYQYSNALSGRAREVGIHDQHVFALKAAFSF